MRQNQSGEEAMSNDYTLNRERYRQHFELNIQVISQIPSPVLRKIVFVVMLESLSKARYPRIKDTRKRFLSCLSASGDWDDRDRVSLPQLLYRLERDNQQTLSALAERVRGEIQGWEWGALYPIGGRDPMAKEVLRWPEIEGLGDQVAVVIGQVRHCNLLYDYRNDLVHEFREPSSGIEVRPDYDYPYYFGLTSDGERIWDLVYPVGFFHRLVTAVLDQVCTYFVEQDIDPYASYDWSPAWRH